MSLSVFEANKPVPARALVVGQRINIKLLEKASWLATAPLVVRAGANGYAVLFRYGTVVFFNLMPMEEAAFLEDLQTIVQDPSDVLEFENAQIFIDPQQDSKKIDGYQISLKECSIEHLQLIAVALAKSVYLAYYETRVAKVFDLLEPMATELQTRGRTGRKTRELLRHMGQALMIHGKMIGHVEVDEKPELLWERPDLDPFYASLSAEYELQPRLAILRQKLNLVHVTTETILSFMQGRRTLHVEWYIVILILFEIVFSLSEKFLGF